MPRSQSIWFSACSSHLTPRLDCRACQIGHAVLAKDHAADQVLFRTDYAEWFRQHNDGREPDESAWTIWRQFTRKDRDT